MSAEAEAVFHGTANPHPPRFVRYVIQIALGIRMIEVDGWRRDLSFQSLNAEHRLNPAGCSQQMSQLTFGAGNCEGVGVLSEDRADRVGLSHIAQRSTGSVSIDVVDVVRFQSGIGDGRLDGRGLPLYPGDRVRSGVWHPMTVRNRRLQRECEHLGDGQIPVLQAP